VLRIQSLNKTYDTGDIALRNINLEVPAGQVLALIGPSGAGKSTLIRCVNRLVEPTSGEVWLEGVEVTRLGTRSLRKARRSMAMIFQEYALIERLSVMENVLSGQLGYVSFLRSLFRRFPTATIQEAYELLERVELAEHFNKRADELSGGQRQRVGIARAVLQHPKLLLVDEPTASLDPRTSRQIMRLLNDICHEKGLSAIINIHDVALAQQFVERIIGLRAGEVVFDGVPEKLTQDVLTDIYGEEDWTELRQGQEAEPSSVIHESDDERLRGLS